LAPSLEYYRLGGLYLLRTLGITTNHGEIRLSVTMPSSPSPPGARLGGRDAARARAETC
jgi:hypothetical protein